MESAVSWTKAYRNAQTTRDDAITAAQEAFTAAVNAELPPRPAAENRRHPNERWDIGLARAAADDRRFEAAAENKWRHKKRKIEAKHEAELLCLIEEANTRFAENVKRISAQITAEMHSAFAEALSACDKARKERKGLRAAREKLAAVMQAIDNAIAA